MFTKVLVANRGEIALRIIRACREMGIKTVAVFSRADRDAIHARMADEEICIGDAPSQSSYLNISALISAAEITDADAIHPGYGFLAENAHFAEICESCGITFIGPTPENMRLMGDKVAARDLMQKSGVPVVPGSAAAVESKEEAIKIARKIKYPIIIKAAAGGGGRGMRVCHNDVRLISALMTAQAEAEKAFGDNTVYIEKYIEEPRHIEIQLLADKYGHIVYFPERDCSVQRRHQKLIEESPSPTVDAKTRKKLGEMAIKGARAANYSSAGTMEFLMDADKQFFFIEMNTRIQVEHPVTEMICGIDLIKEQIRSAAGEKLLLKQESIKMNGAAIECRVNAEDCENNFMPCPGKIDFVHFPGGRNVRIDSHIYAGYTISPYYDSLLGKLIVHGDTREEALAIMRRALGEVVITPLKTTVPFHQRILRDVRFIEGNYSTHLLDDYVDKEAKE